MKDPPRGIVKSGNANTVMAGSASQGREDKKPPWPWPEIGWGKPGIWNPTPAHP